MRTVCMRQLMIRLLLEVIKVAECHAGAHVSEREHRLGGRNGVLPGACRTRALPDSPLVMGKPRR